MNQFGLPRAVDEIEIGLGHLKFHIYPHQVKLTNHSSVSNQLTNHNPGSHSNRDCQRCDCSC